VVAIDISFHLDGDFLQDDGARAGFLALLAMLGSFGFIRMSARLMRSPKVPWWPGSVETSGGLHVHHLVFGIVLILLAGFLSFALQPDGALLTVLAIAFGIGAGLTLDEFALWLYLDDVYWSEEGRRSVDAVIIATIIGGGVALGLVPLGSESESGASLAIAIAFNLGLCILAALKGKIASALIGMFVPVVSLVAAIRLARPGSPWARRRYAPGSKKLAKAEAREERHTSRVVRWQNRIGGAPTAETDSG
jgi:lysyl-tRNA synthetase class 2